MIRTWRAQFVLCQFAVAILIQRFQRGGCIGDFAGIDDSIMVRVERHEQRAGWRTVSAPGAAVSSGTALRTVVAARRRAVLSGGEECCGAEGA